MLKRGVIAVSDKGTSYLNSTDKPRTNLLYLANGNKIW